jgi:very-short-patch-repair endonuclease
MAITIYAEATSKLNFACHQSDFTFLRSLQIKNDGPEKRLENLVVTMQSDPGFLRPKKWQLDRLGPECVLSIKDRNIELNGQFMLDLADSIRGSARITIECNNALLAETSIPVELLAYNEWGGNTCMPELLAAFSMPNDPAIDKLLRSASAVLKKAGKEDKLDGYHSGSRERVWEMASAIYTAVCNLNLAYAVPPAHFESNGQKIRTPGQIIDGKVATCLDTAMLFSSALEQAGLQPLVILTEGHALAGVWLQPEELSSILINDAETLRKRSQLMDLLLFETTMVTSHPSPIFSKSVTAAIDEISIDKGSAFNAAVDIARARAHKIKPLGLKSASSESGQTIVTDEAVQIEDTLEEAPPLADFEQEKVDQSPSTPEGRLENWRSKLLDLSARNPLLNHNSSKSSLCIICPNPGALEDKLAEGMRISIHPYPRQFAGQDESLHLYKTGENISEEFALDALERKQVLVNLPQEELNKRAVAIYRKARTDLQEGGSNTLYLALGFLVWERNEKDIRKFRAPLILLPVTLERKSVRSGIKILLHDDEPRFNTTLLEMLRNNFHIDIKGLEGQLPKDASGIDVNGIWNKIRLEIKEAPGFEVVEDVVLGRFSFAKYLMWKDLTDRTDKLKQNAVVKHLIDSPKGSFPSDISFVTQQQVASDYKPSDLLTPLPADGSQMAAIATADRGKNFVMIGPPGTGKSQTISNLIAHMLGQGKTVLFVSEKTAALEVVHRRLQDVGLSKFCLPLHSNKARKSEVLTRLGQAWEFQRNVDTEEWHKEAKRLLKTRNHLNFLVSRLHQRRHNGMTAYYAIGVKIRDQRLARKVSFSWASANQHNAAQLEEMREAVKKLAIQAAATPKMNNSPFQLIATSRWSPQWENDVEDGARNLSVIIEKAITSWETFLQAAKIDLPNKTQTTIHASAILAMHLLRSHRKQPGFLLDTHNAQRIALLEKAVHHLKAYAKAQSRLIGAYKDTAWRQLDGRDIAERWTTAQSTWWPKGVLLRHRIVKEMMRSGALEKPDPAHDAPILQNLREEGVAIDKMDRQLSSLEIWEKQATDPDAILSLKKLGEQIRSSLAQLAPDAPALESMRESVQRLLGEGNELLAPEAVVGRASRDFLISWKQLRKVREDFENVSGRPLDEYFKQGYHELSAIRQTMDEIAARHSELNSWCKWMQRRTEAMDVELGPLVRAVEKGDVPVDEIGDTFEAAYCTWWTSRLVGEDEVLRTFSVAEQNVLIQDFTEIDKHFRELTARYIKTRVAGELPLPNEHSKSSTWGVLRRELQKKSRHKPVRQLVKEIPDVLTRLTPCLMMSPLSIAQYLPAEQQIFDVVIFDEASQITPWDSVGALARGRQVIVAGDPKQMPPTNFFSKNVGDNNGSDDVMNLESVLDEMTGSGIHTETLNLHYRSRSESLIAFSNDRYYENSLVTFPAPAYPDKAVHLVRPEGYYTRGKSQNNVGEARSIVAEIARRLTHADEKIRNQSIGVVTFNSSQQGLIEDLLDKERSENPDIEWAFENDQVLEPVFVKNLETVQGDERDVILFSITYGPDQSGYVSMNFGPLNREGGERRLNVAMTRAREKMIVFSTLKPDQIALSRTNAKAVADLKHFLVYAERGTSALGTEVRGSVGDFESPFEIAVARALREKGWEVHPQVGVSAYRIDLGIVHPDKAGAYLAGVECDGATYHSSALARERDLIRESVLSGLGWTLFRIWSTDWWINSEAALDRLHKSLTEHLAALRKERKSTQEQNLEFKNASMEADLARQANDSQSETPPKGLEYSSISRNEHQE